MDITLSDKTNSLSKEQLALASDIIEFASKETILQLTEDVEMSVLLVDNEEIHEINRQYRDKNSPTDVISFALEDEGEDEIPLIMEGFDIPRNLGDIFVSVDKIKEQAEEYEHSFERELGFLVVHGFLHLNGFDHMNDEDEKEMFDLQGKILDNYGLKR